MIEKLFESLKGDAVKAMLAPVKESIDSAKAKYVDTGKIEQEVFDTLTGKDPTRNGKYAEWLCREYVKNPDDLGHLPDIAILFDRNKNKMEKGTDINKLSAEEADTIAQQAGASKSNREIKRGKMNEDDIVYEDDEVLIVNPTSHESSKFFGTNTTWCTAKQDRGHWDSYWEQGCNLYYFKNKVKNIKYIISVRPDGSKEIRNSDNVEVSEDEVKDAMNVV